jgi:dienelactone hydrolase
MGLKLAARGRTILVSLAVATAFSILSGALVIFLYARFPLPSGPFAVGEMSVAPEPLALPRQHANDSQPPVLPLTYLWYPAAVSGRSRAFPDLLARLQRRGHANSAVVGSPMIPGATRFPVLLYFPGWPGTEIDNYSLICELVSHGFVVAGLVYPARMSGIPESTYEKQVRDLEGGMLYTSEAAYLNTVREANARVQLRAHDAVAVLDYLTRLDAGSPSGQFAGRLDVKNAGIIGFSLGGAVAAETAVIDSRIRAVVNMDGRAWGAALHQGVARPYLFLGEELLIPTAEDLASSNPDRRYNAILDQVDYAQLASNLKRHGGVQVTVLKTEHLDFTDRAQRWTRRRLLGLKPISPQRAMLITSSYVLAFFQNTLAGRAAPLLTTVPSPFPEVRIQVFPPPDAAANRATN